MENYTDFNSKLTLAEIESLLELCLSTCYFLYDNNIYLLENSGSIGLALMVVMAECFLQFYEHKALLEAQHLTPTINIKSFKQYVDDTHACFTNHLESERFLQLLNKQHENIKYTIEKEDNETKTINFLDVSVTNNMSGTYQFNVFLKNAITNVQIKPNSCHDPKIIRCSDNCSPDSCSPQYLLTR